MKQKATKPEKKRKFDAIVFDLDSTLVTIEGLDQLAQYHQNHERLASLTRQSMDGTLDFHSALKEKMDTIAPSYKNLISLGAEYCRSFVPGADSVIQTLQRTGHEVWIVTGNFRPAVEVVAKRLSIPLDQVLSNTAYFNDRGEYTGFDETNPLSHNGGKAAVIKTHFSPEKRIAFVGDSATDLETSDVVDLFIGFGGVVRREKVEKQAEIYITEPTLLPILNVILTV